MTSTTLVGAPAGARRLFAAPGPSLSEHLETFGPLPSGADLAALLEESGLAGRGGAGFPSARKLRGVAQQGRGVVVGNAAEGEPASQKDHTLLLAAPHLVLDGLVLAARASGAREAFLVASRRDLAEQLERVLGARPDLRNERFDVQVVLVPDRFVSGQESALVNAINGDAPFPSDKLVPVYRRGVHGRPTLVHNIETLAHMALLARFGAAWFQSVGTDEESGTFLATVSGAVPAPNVFEVPFGTPLPQLLRWAGASPEDAQAVLVGGFHGAWIPGEAIGSTAMSRASLRPYGAGVGAGVVMVLGRDRCGLVESSRVAAYLAGESAGQCGPCLNGLPRMAELLSQLAHGRGGPRVAAEVERLQGVVTGRGACAHPDGTARFVGSTMRVFAPEVRLHLGGGCSAARAR